MEAEADAGSGASTIVGGIATDKITTCLVEAEAEATAAEVALKSASLLTTQASLPFQ